MGWRDADEGATAAQFSATLKSEGLCVVVSEETASQILAHNGSTPIKQAQVVTTEEYRGLTLDAAHLLLGLESDATTITIYYAQRSSSTGGTAQYMAAAARTGNMVNVTTSRNNDAGEYRVRVTTTTFSASGDGWSTTRPAASTTGVVVSVTKRRIATTYPVGTRTQLVTTTIKEFPFLTQAEAKTLCTASNSMTATRTAYSDTRMVYTSSSATPISQTYTGYYTTYNGTVVTSSMRYIDEANGWTVTQTTETTDV